MGEPRSFPRQGVGEPIAAATLNRPIEELERIARAGVGRGLASEGYLVRRVEPEEFDARITGSANGGKHSWQAIEGTSGGGWRDVPGHAGTTVADPAYEFNGAILSTGRRVRLRREAYTGELRFQHDDCARPLPAALAAKPSAESPATAERPPLAAEAASAAAARRASFASRLP